MSIPYASASTDADARDEITKVLRRFGCEFVGFMDDFDKHEVLLAFTHRGRGLRWPNPGFRLTASPVRSCC